VTEPATFIWYELISSDPAASTDFYTQVVGWTAHPFGGGDMPYTVLHAGQAGVGGISMLTDAASAVGAKPGWIGYIGVKDADAAAASIAGAGGAILHGPDDIPGVGRFAVVADPQQVPFMLLAPSGAEMPTLERMSPGSIGWREIISPNAEAGFEFYAGQFGWTKFRAVEMGPMGTYQTFADASGAETGGMMNKPPQFDRSGWLFYFVVEGAGAGADRIKAHGGQVLMGAMEVPDGSWAVQAVDPQGVAFALVSKTA
jgi:predicted enzyme related to lactoylglutathione lyase